MILILLCQIISRCMPPRASALLCPTFSEQPGKGDAWCLLMPIAKQGHVRRTSLRQIYLFIPFPDETLWPTRFLLLPNAVIDAKPFCINCKTVYRKRWNRGEGQHTQIKAGGSLSISYPTTSRCVTMDLYLVFRIADAFNIHTCTHAILCTSQGSELTVRYP